MPPVKTTIVFAATLSLMASGTALADGKGKPNHAKGKPPAHAKAAKAYDCPPGLAKKDPPCIPPGQVKKGDRIDDRFERLEDLWLDRLGRDGNFYRLGDRVFDVDPDTQEIIEVLGVLADISGN